MCWYRVYKIAFLASRQNSSIVKYIVGAYKSIITILMDVWDMKLFATACRPFIDANVIFKLEMKNFTWF